jgi:hypothetical protein
MMIAGISLLLAAVAAAITIGLLDGHHVRVPTGPTSTSSVGVRASAWNGDSVRLELFR